MAVPRLVLLGHGEEERAPGIPQSLLEALLDARRLRPKLRRRPFVALRLGDAGDGQRVGPEVAVERRPVARRAAHGVLGLSAVDVDLHAVVVPGLPEEADLGDEVRLFPPL